MLTFLWNRGHGRHEMRVQFVREIASLGQEQAVDVGGVGVDALRHFLGDCHKLDWKLGNVHGESAECGQRGFSFCRIDLKT